MLYEVNLGIRDYYTYTDAMFNNSLFSRYLIKNGLNVYRKKQDSEFSKDESTRDIICLDFDFGSRSYEEELSRLEKMLTTNISDDVKSKIISTIQKTKNNKTLYSEKKRGEIRKQFYENGVDITYQTKNKDGTIKREETIHYEMLFRTPSKAKFGQVIFINSKLYDKAYDWLTIGLGNKMSYDNAKIVEMSAYAPLTTSTIVGDVFIPIEDILILKDQDSFFNTLANVVKAEYYINEKGEKDKKCVVTQENMRVKNTVWDGMGIVESDIMPEWVNGMALLRNHLFKACVLRGQIQLFFKDWCNENGYDYNTHQVQDMFGNWHYLKDIKMITTDKSIKWLK